MIEFSLGQHLGEGGRTIRFKEFVIQVCCPCTLVGVWSALCAAIQFQNDKRTVGATPPMYACVRAWLVIDARAIVFALDGSARVASLS